MVWSAVVVLAPLTWLSVSIGSYLTAPGDDPVSARLAEWGRDHGLGFAVVGLEKAQYTVHPPKVGGAPPPDALPLPSTARPSRLRRVAPALAPRGGVAASTLALRPRIRPIASPALPREGSWQALVRVHGEPAVQAAYLRPDARHTSYVTGVVWMSHRYLSFHLHPGFDQPGGVWPVPDWIPPGHRRGLVATWNGAFKLADAHGGFFLDSRTAGILRPGAASEVFYRNGSMDIGAWNEEVRMSSRVVGVRQNLALLVDHGRIAPNIDTNPQINWGLTLGGAYYIFRSGVGVTASGDIVYASGDALSAFTLARVLRRAGCVRAMELDINPAWVSFMSYHARGHPASPVPTSLLHDYQRPANRYFTHTSRDFVAVYAR